MNTRVESFTEFQDASNWLEKALGEIPESFTVYNAGVNFINNRWRVGFSSGPKQGDLYNA